MISIYNFLSPKLVIALRLKISFYPTINTWMGEERDSCLSQRY